jgi:gamma-glutamyltranspeptidase/glutathione hydrolase
LLGDPDHYPVNIDSIIHAKPQRQAFPDFDPLHATSSLSLYPDSLLQMQEKFETTHISVIDKGGNAASLTTTLNGNYGCKVWFPEGGYFLNNEMDDFSSKPGTPNYFGLIGGEANAIAPGKRMLSSMTPTIITKGDKLFMVLGTPGGSTIMTSILQVFLNKTVFDATIDEAVQMPRYHHQWLPDVIMHESSTFDSSTMRQLKSMGHTFELKEALGAVEAIYVDGNGIRHGAADHRSDDHACGY